MKKLFILILLPFVWLSCSSPSNYEKVIIDYLETDKKGIKTDLHIEILSIHVSDITVSDSITILKGQFDAEKAKKVQTIETSITYWQNKIEEQKGKKNQIVAKSLISNFSDKLAQAENELKAAKERMPDYLNSYESYNSSDILAKKADCQFSFFNPQLQTRQEMKAVFILSSDGKQCNNMIKQ